MSSGARRERGWVAVFKVDFKCFLGGKRGPQSTKYKSMESGAGPLRLLVRIVDTFLRTGLTLLVCPGVSYPSTKRYFSFLECARAIRSTQCSKLSFEKLREHDRSNVLENILSSTYLKQNSRTFKLISQEIRASST